MKQYDRLKYALPPVITAILLLIVYAVKHIYPFGNYTIDYYDMAQQIASFYYHVYDFLHGEKNLFYDQYTALSVNMAMSTSGCSHLSIFNLFFLFIKREMLLESLSFFLLIKMMFMSLFMYVFLHKKYKVDYAYEVAFSVIYSFSGYVLMLYMTIQWLDIAALFPLLMYFLHLVLEKGECKGYIAVLTMCVVACYYLSFMILIYIVLMVGTVILGDYIFEKRGYSKWYNNYHLPKLFFSTLISTLLSMFILIPQMYQTLLSARFNNESSGGILGMYYEIVSTSEPAYTTRWWTLLLSSLSFAIIVYGVIVFRKEVKSVTLTIAVLVIMLSELIVEGVNLFWHFGSYVQYPIRNGFMINFTLSVLAVGYLERIADRNEKDDEKKLSTELKLSGVLLVSVSTIAVMFIKYYVATPGLPVRKVFHMTTAAMAITFVVYLAFLFVEKGRYLKSTLIILAVECVVFGFILIGKPTFITGYTEDTEQEGEYIRICDQINETFDLGIDDYTESNGGTSLFSRVKNPDTSLNSNYGLVLKKPVLSNWTHLLSPKLQRDAAKLGYTVQYTRLLDSGGTVFSDAIIGVDQIITCVPQDEQLYKLKASSDIVIDHISGLKKTYYLYDCKYKMPFGVVVDNINYGFDENSDICDVYNEIYKSISGKGDSIAQYEIKSQNVDSGSVQETLSIQGKKSLYYFADQVDTDDYNTIVKVNGETVLVPSIGETDNIYYPAHFNNNALYLGTFENDNVSIDIEYSSYDLKGNEIDASFNPRVVSIDLELLNNICDDRIDKVTDRSATKNSYRFDVSIEESESLKQRYMLLPLSYDEGYSAKANEASCEVLPVGGIFTAVPLNSGDGIIEITFTPKGMTIGIVISVLTVILLVMFVYINKKSDILERQYNWLTNLYMAGYVFALIIMYIVPYCFYILNMIHIL